MLPVHFAIQRLSTTTAQVNMTISDRENLFARQDITQVTGTPS
jgi:hypothetical protein